MRFQRMGCFYKNTHISAAAHPRILNLVSNLFKDIAVVHVGYANYLIRIFMNVNENIRKE